MSTTTLFSQAATWSFGETPNVRPDAIEEESLSLSDRENEIMHWVGAGKTNYEIGLILGISQFTVKNHLQRIFRKIDVRNRAQAITRILSLSQPASIQ